MNPDQRAWTKGEEDTLRKMGTDNFSAHEIAETLRRTVKSVFNRASKLRIPLRRKNLSRRKT